MVGITKLRLKIGQNRAHLGPKPLPNMNTRSLGRIYFELSANMLWTDLLGLFFLLRDHILRFTLQNVFKSHVVLEERLLNAFF